MRYRYFILSVGYDGHGQSCLRNDVVLRREPIAHAEDVVRLERDLDQVHEGSRLRHHQVLHFILLGEERPHA